ncbi:MAG: 50S ribosomal protein L32 [Pseudomonadota bacterium]|nr:50S ribosomal protein L32 [Gammaproteobacteria bacterium]MBU1559071.1 50S ribosomal protein L32 [Gammaproteobacteria bacterium]MBU1926322.1 50S ribosomal protein L32 [Gammaproteobacteria bacterium]MBU2546234.1 50S ribosomal protein L32 [Gammaproteobacteria bacterium]
MAVQKSRKSRSRRGMRRAHTALNNPTLAEEQTTGEMHRRHHVSKDGYYRGKQVIESKQKDEQAEEE